jgi:hypothetical protein
MPRGWLITSAPPRARLGALHEREAGNVGRQGLGDAEVEDLDRLVAQHDVRRLQVAVHDVTGVRRLQGPGDLDAGAQRPGYRQPPAVYGPLERLAFEQLENEVGHSVALLEAVNRGDVRMVDRGQDLGLALEPGEQLRIGGRLAEQHLDGHLSTQLGVAGTIDPAHAARTEQADDLVLAQCGAGFHDSLDGPGQAMVLVAGVQSDSSGRPAVEQWPPLPDDHAVRVARIIG